MNHKSFVQGALEGALHELQRRSRRKHHFVRAFLLGVLGGIVIELLNRR